MSTPFDPSDPAPRLRRSTTEPMGSESWVGLARFVKRISTDQIASTEGTVLLVRGLVGGK